MSAAAVSATPFQRAVTELTPQTLPAPVMPYQRRSKPLGDPTPLACTVAKTALEAVLGEPGVEKLTRWVSAPIRAALAQQHSLARRAGKSLEAPVRITRVRVCRVHSGAAEVSIVADDGRRSRAIAMRVEDVAGRWLTTVLEVG